MCWTNRRSRLRSKQSARAVGSERGHSKKNPCSTNFSPSFSCTSRWFFASSYHELDGVSICYMNEDKKTRKAPAFQFYADDFLAGTADMSAEEVGGYIRLLCHQWSKGGIPSDEDRSARIAGLMGSPSIRYVLAKFTLCDGDMLKNVRLEQIRQDWSAKAMG